MVPATLLTSLLHRRRDGSPANERDMIHDTRSGSACPDSVIRRLVRTAEAVPASLLPSRLTRTHLLKRILCKTRLWRLSTVPSVESRNQLAQTRPVVGARKPIVTVRPRSSTRPSLCPRIPGGVVTHHSRLPSPPRAI